MQIVPLNKEINKDALSTLEAAIVRVKTGEIVSVGIAWVDDKGAIAGDVSAGNDRVKLWASMQHMTNEFYNDVVCAEDE